MAQQPIDQSQLDSTIDAQSLQGQTIGAGANQIVQRDGSGNVDADTLGGLSVGTGANNIVQLDGSGALPAVDGSALLGVGSGPEIQIARKTANESVTSSTAVQADDHLDGVLTLAANQIYKVDAIFLASDTVSGAGIKFNFGLPSGANMETILYKPLVTSDVAFHQYTGQSATVGFNLEVTLTNVLKWTGIIQMGATAGSLNVYWAQNVSDPTATVLEKDSHIILTKLT